MADIRVEVVYALAGAQEMVMLQLPAGASAAAAVAASGLAGLEGKAGAGRRLGIGGREIAPTRVLRDGDRVELLRPLAADPKEARRARARKAQKR